MDVGLELRSGAAQRRQSRHHRELTRPQIKPGSRINVTERKLDNVFRHVRRDILQGRDRFKAKNSNDQWM
jgi:hypothetical protein